MLAHLRVHVPRWLALVDRTPPADLFEALLPELAYAYEIRGPRRQQAWENLKKMRGLIRRIQNRGYATLARIADHIDALSAGDESNAVLEAIDAVNLMTVHASKGLEFPIVFVVNMARGAAGLPRPVRVIVDSGDEAPSVSVAPFVSETDALEREREQHETRRLVYVAITRARDRLYLSSTLKDGLLRPGPGSLADVLPASLKGVFVGRGKHAGRPHRVDRAVGPRVLLAGVPAARGRDRPNQPGPTRRRQQDANRARCDGGRGGGRHRVDAHGATSRPAQRRHRVAEGRTGARRRKRGRRGRRPRRHARAPALRGLGR